jgi:adenine-specific DNA-methyltransferase
MINKVEPQVIEELRTVVETFGSKYISEGTMIRSSIYDALSNFDETLIDALLNNEFILKHYTRNISGTVIFELEKFKEILVSNQYFEKSYTKYANKIGLTISGKYIDEATEVVLDFPYKDGVLKASMSKEDVGKDDFKPDEMVLNKIIAKSEIDVMLDKKILVNAKRYDKEGEHTADSFDSENDNLIIKGNNLLALHSLKEKYSGKVKLIYIDPPYNTGGDSFIYNDKFNHSTWLTFMKNRLEVAFEMLADGGSI